MGNSGENVGNFYVLSIANSTMEADTVAVQAGILGGVSGGAIATVDAPIEASIATGAEIVTTGNVNVEVRATADADATAWSVNTGAAALGVSVATATISPSIMSFIAGGVSIGAGATWCRTRSLRRQQPSHRRQRCDADARTGSGGLVAAQGAIAIAESSPVVDTFIGAGSIIEAGGNASLASLTGNESDATAAGIAGGAVGIGATSADAFVHGSTTTHLDAAEVRATGDVR